MCNINSKCYPVWFILATMLLVWVFGQPAFAIEVIYQSPQKQLIFLRPQAGNQGLTKDWKPLNGLVYPFKVAERSFITVYGHVGVQHFQKNRQETMVGLNLWDENNKAIKGFVATTNLSPERHYENMVIIGSYVVQPGEHMLQIVGRLLMNQDGAVFVKDPSYSGVWVRIEPLPPTVLPPSASDQ